MTPLAPLLVGVAACSTAVIVIKASATPPIWLAADRLLLAALLLLPLAIRDARRRSEAWSWSELRPAIAPGLFLALHFATWIVGARMIPAANSSLLANLVPAVMPVVAWLLLRVQAKSRELAATGVALLGVAALALGDLDASAACLAGDALCFGSMLCLTVYLALAGRLRRDSLWLYVVPLYAIAGLATVPVALLHDGLPPLPRGPEPVLILALALVPTVIGHSLLNRAMGQLRPQVVSVLNLAQVPLAGLMAWALWHELPSLGFLAACAAILLAAGILVWPKSSPAACCAAG